MAFFQNTPTDAKVAQVMLRDLLQDAEARLAKGTVLTVSVRPVSDVDGRDLNALLRLYLKVSDVGGKLVLRDVAPKLAEKLRLTRMGQLVDVDMPHTNSASNAQANSNRGKLFEISQPTVPLFFDRA